MDPIALIDAAAAESERLADVLIGKVKFCREDYTRFRELVAELKRQEDADLSLFGRKLDEWYQSIVRFNELRNKYPTHSRIVRKEIEAANKALATIERIGERIEAAVYRKAGEQNGV